MGRHFKDTVICLGQMQMESMSGSPPSPNVTPSIDKPIEVCMSDWMKILQSFHVPRSNMNNLIMNYLVTEGFKEAAEKFGLESGIKPNVELDTLDERIKIRNAIQDGKIPEAIDLINNIQPELLDNNKILYFHLLQQQTIELIRDSRIEDALEFAQNHLADKGEEDNDLLPEIECTLALLAFNEPEKSPYGDLLHPGQRQRVASEVNAAILFMENQETTPKLAGLLKLLLWEQQELDKKKVKFPHMADIGTGTLDPPL